MSKFKKLSTFIKSILSSKFFSFWFKWVFLTSAVIVVSIIIYLVVESYNLPSIEALQNYKPVQMTKIISADGKPIRELYIEQRDIVNIAKVPQDLRKGLVLMEDRKFFDHPGIDIWGILRAISVDVTGGRTQGASTLTQQLARNMYSDIGFEKSFIRKVREAITAYNIENVYTKSEIMELYLNSVFFGHRAYGIQQASKYYFGKDVKTLNLNECATLVGILPAPNTYSPKKNINTVIGHSADFYNFDYEIFDNIKGKAYLKTSNSTVNQYFPLTKIDGELKNNSKDAISNVVLSDLVFLNNKLDTVNIIFRNNKILNNSISVEYDYSEKKLVVNLVTDEKIQYYKFKVEGLGTMKINGIGGGDAEYSQFIEINNSSRALDRKNLVLRVMEEKKYINQEKYYYHSLLPLNLSISNTKKEFGLASYFTEDVRRELLNYRQSSSYNDLDYILPDFLSKKYILKEWLNENYKMVLNIDGKQSNLYKDGLRVYCTLDTRIQKFVSDIFQEEMEKNQNSLFHIYDSPKNRGLIDSIITISKNRKTQELKSFYKSNFTSSLEAEIINREREKWRQFNKTEDEIDDIIEKGRNKAERFIDSNNNRKWDPGERFFDGNKQYNKGERFTDANKNNQYDPGEIFIDKKNKQYDKEGFIPKKLRAEINKLVKESMDSLNYDSRFILNLLKNKDEIPEYLRKEFLVQGSLVVLDVETGNIIAMIGGRQEGDYIDYFNRSSQALRQPGSVFKPFVYMTGLKNYDYMHKPFSPNYQIQNQPIQIGEYKPENFDGKTGGKKTLREGLKKSINLIAVRLIAGIEGGPQKVKNTAENFGITSSIYPGEALALGASSVYPLEITAAYSAIANNGTLMKPSYIYKIENSLGRTLKEIDSDEFYSEENEAVTYLIRDMMRDVVDEGTGGALRWKYKFHGPVAGKTGTTNKFTDAWFVGFTPQIAIGVWVGMDNPAVSIKKYGGDAALPIFSKSIKKIYDFGEYSLGNQETRKLDSKLDWEEPETGLTKRKICKESKRIARKYCKSKAGVVEEIFLENYVLEDKCNIKAHSSRYK